MTADRQSGMLPRDTARPARPLAAGVLALGAMAAALVVFADAPAQVEHTRIVIVGGDRAAVVMALINALQIQAPEPVVDPVAQPDGVQIDRRLPVGVVDPGPQGTVLAARAIASATVALLPPPAAAPVLAPDRITPELVAQRTSLQGARDEADRSAASLSTALSGVVRDSAAMQALEALPSEQSANAPTRKMLADLQMRRIDLAARYTADYPGIAIADSEIVGLKALLAQAALKRPPHPAAASLATLAAERLRLQTALQSEIALRDELSTRIGALDRMIAQQLTRPADPRPPAAAPAFRAAIIPLPTTTLPDQRPRACGAIAAGAILAAWWVSRRRRVAVSGLAARVQAIEQMIQLPVLRCLDVDGRLILGGGLLADPTRPVRALPETN